MITSQKCPTCGATLIAHASGGHCVRCLLQLALTPDDAVPLPAGETPNFEQPGEKVGRYKLLQQIGEGGCGVVYMAEQEEPVRRYVALKLIKGPLKNKGRVKKQSSNINALGFLAPCLLE